jgi:hypothetical protein
MKITVGLDRRCSADCVLAIAAVWASQAFADPPFPF